MIQVALEGRINRESVQASLRRGVKASGDMIPWTVSQQFQDHKFAQLSGARVVRIAVHPDATKMGYGTYVGTVVCFVSGDTDWPSLKLAPNKCGANPAAAAMLSSEMR